jgi:hypothetical protein
MCCEKYVDFKCIHGIRATCLQGDFGYDDIFPTTPTSRSPSAHGSGGLGSGARGGIRAFFGAGGNSHEDFSDISDVKGSGSKGGGGFGFHK